MALNSGKILMRRGQEVNFDPNKMMPGEWAVSLDSKFVRMCFSPGVCIRMATYEAFEADMEQIRQILAECESIEQAVSLINTEVSQNAKTVIEYTKEAKQYRDEAKQYRDEAFSTTPDGYDSLVGQVNKNTVAINAIVEKTELNIKETAMGENIHLIDSAEGKVVEFTLYGKAVQNGTPTPENPVDIEVAGSDGSVKVKSVGKNKQNPDNILKGYPDASGTSKNAKFVSNDTTRSMFFAVSGGIEYTVSLSKACDRNMIYFCNSIPTDLTSEQYYSHFKNETMKTEFSIVAPSEYKYCAIYLGTNFTQDETIQVQVEEGSVSTEYQPYKEPTTALISTPEGLAGILVDSGGNYTDQNGQQWICDEIVKYADGSGKRIQRIGKAVFDGSEDEEWRTESTNQANKYRISTPKIVDLIKKVTNNNDNFNGVCNAFEIVPTGGVGTYGAKTGISCGMDGKIQVYADSYNTNDVTLWTSYLAENPTTLYYELATPIRTPLTAEEIAEIEKLSTFYPVTNISNDFGCGMKVKYIVDSKNYIDNQLAIQAKLQEEALLNMLLLMPEEVQASMIEKDTNNLLNESEV